MIKENREVGSIACVVEKDEGDPVQYVMNYAKQIEETNGRGVSSHAGKLVDSGYPGTLVFRPNGSQRSLNAETGAEDATEYPVDIKVKDLLEQADPDMLELLGVTSEELYNCYIEAQRTEEERIHSLWEEIKAASSDIVLLTDEEVLESTLPEASSRSISVDSEDTFLLWDWFNKRSWWNPGGDCATNVLTFITLGLGKNSGYSNNALVNEWTKIQSVYNWFFKKLGSYEGAHTYLQMMIAFMQVTNYSITTDNLHNWSTINSNIRSNNLPAISLRSSILWTNRLGWHYRTIIGTCDQRMKNSKSFLWMKWNEYYNNYWYYMHDNTVDGGNFWELAGQYYQFHSAHVKK
ncbi:MAG: hypothetical protein EWM51_10015 [Treponema sp.]|nr:MAG: hypothetical protein EWM51_10015 [Treponema sp.]